MDSSIGKPALGVLRQEVPDWDERIERERAEQVNREAPELAEHGAIGNGRKDDSRDYNVTSKGNSAEYLAARIKRDRPDNSHKKAPANQGDQHHLYYAV